MVKSKEEIIKNISDHFKNINYNVCYVGITSDVNGRLFGDHNISRENNHWIYRTASSSSIAREIEQHFIDLGMDGVGGGGDEESKIVYAYKKTSSTNP